VNAKDGDYRLSAILCTDIDGDPRRHQALVAGIAARHRGAIIKPTGDAILIDFRNTVEAMRCAMEIQAAAAGLGTESGSQPIRLRMGLHLGDIQFFEEDAVGDGITIAERLQASARPGSIRFSEDVYNQVLGKLDFNAEKLGKVALPDIGKELQTYEIAGSGHEPSSGKPAPGGPGVDRTVLDDIRKAILADTKNLGRRLTVGEAMERYGEYGVEAREVIAAMTEKGLIQRRETPDSRPSPPTPPGGPSGASSDLAADIGRAVEGIARAIEQSVGDWQKAGKYPSRQGRGDGVSHGERLGLGAERIVRKLEHAATKVDFAFDEKRALKAEYSRHAAEVATGKWDAELRNSEHFKPGAEELETDFSRYRDRIETKAQKASAGFVGNLLSFVGVNAFLWYINLVVAPGFMWAPIVSAAWGTGVVSGFFAMLRGKGKASEVDRMPELEPDALEVYKKINRVRDGMAMHFASTLSVPPLLFVINMLTSSGFLWAAIPSGIMALSFLGHLLSYPGTLRGLERKLWRLVGVDSWKELFRLGRNRRAGASAGPYASLYAEVAQARDEMVRDLKAGKGSAEFDKDMIPMLDRYVEQVKLLSHSLNDIDSLVASIPTEALRRDKAALEAKRSGTASQALKDEYSRSIGEIESQEKACADLEDQRELLRLRLGSSANALKQLKLDMARMKALPEAGEGQAIEAIRKKASELAGYMDDLRTGYEETAKDPYAELERLVAEADVRAARLPPSDEGASGDKSASR
jgi:hypothetical protein